MKDCDKNNKRLPIQFRKHSISEKTRSDINTNPFLSRDEPFSPFLARGMKSMGRKYAQQNVFKPKEKEHHEIVISDEVVRNSKLYRTLREKMQMKQSLFAKQCSELTEIKARLKQQIAQVKSNSYNRKLTVWQLKNQILELKGILNDQQQENNRLERQLINPQQNYYEPQYEDQEELPNECQQQMQEQNGDSSSSGGQHQLHSGNDNHSLLELDNPIKINPENGIISKLCQEQDDID